MFVCLFVFKNYTGLVDNNVFKFYKRFRRFITNFTVPLDGIPDQWMQHQGDESQTQQRPFPKEHSKIAQQHFEHTPTAHKEFGPT